MYLVMKTLQSGCFGVIFECSETLQEICLFFFHVYILSGKVKKKTVMQLVGE